MAKEATVARESGVSPLNAMGTPRRSAGILFNNGNGKTGTLKASSSKGKNEAMRFIQDHLYVRGGSENASVDDFVRENNGSYEVKIWNTTGRGWDGWYGTIVPHRNNTGKVLSFKKQRGRWSGTLTENGNYGMRDKVTKVF